MPKTGLELDEPGWTDQSTGALRHRPWRHERIGVHRHKRCWNVNLFRNHVMKIERKRKRDEPRRRESVGESFTAIHQVILNREASFGRKFVWLSAEPLGKLFRGAIGRHR